MPKNKSPCFDLHKIVLLPIAVDHHPLPNPVFGGCCQRKFEWAMTVAKRKRFGWVWRFKNFVPPLGAIFDFFEGCSEGIARSFFVLRFTPKNSNLSTGCFRARGLIKD